MPKTTTLKHPDIGSIVGNADSEDVTRYLGLQYATLVDRFAPPQLKQYSQDETVDATRNGPQVLAAPNGFEHEAILLQHSLDYDRDAVRMSDVEGLNLNVYMPANLETLSNKKLPVFAFIHGGGFHGGSSSFPSYDMSYFVRISTAKGLPVIAVSLNYRVGAPGFLHSQEMKEAGCLPNNAFRDQRTALLWLQKYIAGFGGNPEEVTLMGESAGAVSTAVHLNSEKPLFKRAMLMSGSTLLMGPSPMGRAEPSYMKAVKALGLDSLSAQERIEKLVRMDGQRLRSTLFKSGVAPQVSIPLVDGDICPTTVDFKAIIEGTLKIPGEEWCESLVLGDCAFDGSILGLPVGRKKAGIAKAFVDSISGSLPEQTVSQLLTGYGISPSTDDEQAFEKVLQFGGDVSFYTPTLAFAQNMAKTMPVHMYRFNEANDWPGPWQGRSTHIHDLTYLLQNFNQYLSGDQSQLAESFAASVIDFANGKVPWQQWTLEQKVARVLAAGDSGVKEDLTGQNGRRQIILDLASEVGFDALSRAWHGFMVS